MSSEKRKKKFYASLFLGWGYTIYLFLGMFLLIVVIWILPNSFENAGIFVKFIIIFMCGFTPLALWIALIHRGFTVVEFKNDGIYTSLFRIFRKKVILYDEVVDMTAESRFGYWLFFSTIPLSGMSYSKMVSNKHIIQVELSEKMIDVLKNTPLFPLYEQKMKGETH